MPGKSTDEGYASGAGLAAPLVTSSPTSHVSNQLRVAPVPPSPHGGQCPPGPTDDLLGSASNIVGRARRGERMGNTLGESCVRGSARAKGDGEVVSGCRGES